MKQHGKSIFITTGNRSDYDIPNTITAIVSEVALLYNKNKKFRS
jgi:hypothetical protein